MALLFIDGFDHYAADDISKKWNSVELPLTNYDFPTGRFSGQSIELGGSGNNIVKNFTPGAENVYVGFAVKPITQLSDSNICHLKSSTGFDQFTVAMTAAGHLEMTIFGGSTTAGTATISQDTWYYIEIHYIPSNTSGTIEVKVDGVSDILVSGSDTVGTGSIEDVRALDLDSGSANTTCHFDDLYILDSTGSSNNSYLGDSKIVTTYPTSDVSVNFTPLSGTNFSNVDDATDIDDDTTYVENGTINAHDRFTSGTIGSVSTIHGVQVCTAARKTDAEIRGFKTTIKSGTTLKEDLTEHQINATYTCYTDVYDVDPDTSTAWTKSGVDSLEFGYKVTT